jgi:hypothetical protein
MSLLEILAAIAVSTIMFIGLVDLIDVSLEDARGQQAAHHQSQVVDAAHKYIAANYPALKTATAAGAVAAVTMPDLKTAGFLPNSFADSNSYQHNSCVLVLQDLSVGKLNALVTGYGGQPIPDRSIAAVAMGAGQGAGYIAAADATTARGSSWRLNTTPYRSGTCLGGVKPLNGTPGDAGHLVSNIFYNGPGQLSTDFVYRDAVPGRPDLNRMNVPLQMASAALVNLGDPCPQPALALENTAKDVVVCDGGKWRYTTSSWKEPVANYAALAAVSKADGDVRVTRDTGRAFVYDGGTSSWTAMAIDQNGDLNVPRDLPVGRNITADGTLYTKSHIFTDSDINVGKNAYISGLLDANGNVNIAQNLDIGQRLTARGYIDAKGDMDIVGYVHSSEVRGKWMAADVIVLDGRENPGGPCNFPGFKADGTPVVVNPIGTMLTDMNGLLLNCASDSTFKYANGAYVP